MRVREDADRTRDALDTSRFVVALWSAVSIESDSGRAEALDAGQLTNAGLSVWWDCHIPPGSYRAHCVCDILGYSLCGAASRTASPISTRRRMTDLVRLWYQIMKDVLRRDTVRYVDSGWALPG